MLTMAKKLSLPAIPAYFVKDSVIHGRGLYAARDIRKGERILEYVGKRSPKLSLSAVEMN